MKIKLFSLAFLFMLSFISSCNYSSKGSVKGKWSPVEVDEKYILSYRMSIDDLNNMIEKTTIEFKGDSKFISILPNYTLRGTYTYDENQKHLTTIPENGKAVTFTVELLQPNKMALSNEFGKMTLIRQ